MKPFLQIIIACLVVTVAMSVGAESSNFRVFIQQQSKVSGMAMERVTLLERTGEKNLKTVRDTVLATLKSTHAVSNDAGLTDTNDSSNAMVTGNGWMLHVAGKGNWIRYRDMRNLDKGSINPFAMGKEPTAATLEKQGRNAIANHLGDVIALGAGETLELWYTAVEVRGGRDKKGTQQEAIHNAKAVFTRVVDGIPVLGNGSKVTVFLSTEGTMVGFDVDWSPMVKSKTAESSADLNEIVRRFDDLRSITGTTEEQFEDTMECGYYDVGARQESIGRIQPACLVTRNPTTSNGTPVVLAIPAAAEVPADTFWPEAVALQTKAK